MDRQGAGDAGFDAEQHAPGGFADIDDPELAAAIEASYRTQTQTGQSEDQMLAQAMHLSRLEEEERRKRLGGEEVAEQSADTRQGSSGRGYSSLPAASPYAAGSSSSGAGSASSSAAPSLQPPAGRTQWTGPRAQAFDEDEEGSDAAVAGGSSRGSSRGPGRDGERWGEGSPRLSGLPHVDDELNDPHLAAAIEASYAAQTEHGMVTNEEDLIQQALRISQMEEESRQRATLKEQQEMELQESLLMDQMREQEEKRRRVEEEELRALEVSRAEEDERQRLGEERRQQAEQEQKRARVPPEPPAGEPGRVDLQIRTPEGKRLRRAFRGTDTIGQVYDYVDVEGVLGEAFAGKAYRLVSTMPRREYEDRGQTLQEANLQGQCALLIEPAEA